jgi:hypothetical protein
VPSATPAVYRGVRVINAENAIVWPGVTLIAPGAGQRTLRITNIRANVAALGVSASFVPTQVVAYLSSSPAQTLLMDNPQQTVAYVQHGLAFDVSACNGSALETPVNVNQCQGQNVDWYDNPGKSGTFPAQFGLRFREGFQTAFKTRISPNQALSIRARYSPPRVGLCARTRSVRLA